MGHIQRAVAHLLFAAAAAVPFAGQAWATPRCEGNLPRTRIDSNQEETLRLLRNKRYAELQRRMDGYLQAYVAGTSSDEELFYQFGAFDRWGPFLTPVVQEWVAQFPKSFAAHQAMALHLASVAWQTRGGGLANETSDKQMESFHVQLAAARDWAARAATLHPKPVLAYQQLLVTSKAARPPTRVWPYGVSRAIDALLNRSRAVDVGSDAKELLGAGLRVQPDSVVLRHAYIATLAPRWGGSLEALEDYAKASSHPGLSPDRMASVAYEARLTVAADFYFREDFEQAAKHYQAATQFCKLNQPFLEVAAIRLHQARFADALQAADSALAMVPLSPAGRRARALALRGLGRHGKAFAALLELAPEGYGDVLYLIGEYYADGAVGVDKNMNEARRFLALAARAGEERAGPKLAALDAAAR